MLHILTQFDATEVQTAETRQLDLITVTWSGDDNAGTARFHHFAITNVCL